MLYPVMPDTLWAMHHFLEVIGKKATYPPLGLLTIAAMLPEEWDKRVVDLNVRPVEDQEIQWADFVFLSAMNVQEASVKEIVATCIA